MNPHEPQLAWLLWSLLLIGVWIIIYALFRNRQGRKEMLVVSLWTSLFGLTEPIFVPSYWNPPSLFDLAHRTGFDIESLIFAFAIGGIAVVFYDRIFGPRHITLPATEQHQTRHRYHQWALATAPIVFLVLYFASDLNPIYSSVIAFIAGGIATWYCRSDLKKKMIISAFIFLALYFFYFLTLIAAYPGYVEQVWRLNLISGILIIGIPIEELMFAFSFGFFWSSVYEHVEWLKLSER